jgi:integrase/recombinase XerD
MSMEIAIPPVAIPVQASSDEQLLELWLHGRSRHTQRAYRSDVGKFQRGSGKPLRQLTLGDLQDFADGLIGLENSSRYRILSSIKSLLAFGHRIGYLPFDVGRVLHLPAVRNDLAERILPETDLHRMLNLEPDERNQVLLTLLYASGARRGELAGLRWHNLQMTVLTGQITVFGKGGKTRSIQLPGSLWKKLQRLRGDAPLDAPVFPSRKRKQPLTESGIWRIVKKAAVRARVDLPVSPHWLRHAHASHALDRGAPIHLVQTTLGHASITTTGKYLHARPKESSSRFLPL